MVGCWSVCAADETPEDGALRELVEELGSPWLEQETNVLGTFHDTIAVTGTHVTPVIGVIDRDLGKGAPVDPSVPASSLDTSVFDPHPSEVDEVFALPLRTLLNPRCSHLEDLSPEAKRAGIQDKHPGSKGAARPLLMPVFLGGPVRVWGLTAYILDLVLKEVILPSWEEATGEKLRLPRRDLKPRG